MTFEQTLINALVTNESFARRVLPFVKPVYFDSISQRTVFTLIDGHVEKYNRIPPADVLEIELDSVDNLSEADFKQAKQIISSIVPIKNEEQWLVDKTEEFCQTKALYGAVRQAIAIIDDKADLNRAAIPELLQQALQVSFSTAVGHDFLEDWSDRYDDYTKKLRRIEFDIDYLNKITNGGVVPKTLNCLMAGCVHPETKVKIRFKKRG